MEAETRVGYIDAKGHVQFDKFRSYWQKQLNTCSNMDLSFIIWRTSHGFCCDGRLP